MLIWNKKEKFEHLQPEQVQYKMDELVRDKKVIPVSKIQQFVMDQLYTIEVWVHFKSNTKIAVLYKDPIYEDVPEPEPSIITD